MCFVCRAAQFGQKKAILYNNNNNNNIDLYFCLCEKWVFKKTTIK